MSKTVLEPKFVKRANSWCVTVFKEVTSTNTKKPKGAQSISWFGTKEEADNFRKQQENS